MNLVIEGPEGSGKSTLVAELGKHIPDSVTCIHPGSTVLGQKLRKMIKYDGEIRLSPHTEQIMFVLDLCDFIEKILIPNTQMGKTVISDRSNLVSGMVYGLAGGLSMDRIEMLHRLSLVLDPPKMHLVILEAGYVDLLARRGGRAESDDKFEKLGSDFHRRVCECYSMLANGGTYVDPSDIDVKRESFGYREFVLPGPIKFIGPTGVVGSIHKVDATWGRCREFVMPGTNNGLSIHKVDATLPQGEVLDRVLGIIKGLE
jgi:dTMP kinase